MSTQGSQVSQLSQQELKNLVSETVIYIMSHEHTKRAIKRQDIVKNVLKTHSGAFKLVMENVTTELLNVFGIKLVELGTTKQYILVNKFHNTPEHHLFLSPEVRSQQVLLLLTLSLIYMQGGTAKEENLFQFFQELGIYTGANSGSHPYFGDVHKLITKDFVGQLYLEFTRIPDSDPPIYIISMGTRALQEVSGDKLMEFATKMYGGPVKRWPLQLPLQP